MQERLLHSPYSPGTITDHRYTVRFAQTPEDLDSVLRLRFEVFNLELGEGLDSSFLTGRDRDIFDDVCDHLMVLDHATGAVVGTYRMQTYDAAMKAHGFYSADEFDVEAMPSSVLSQSVEIGRACIVREHRKSRVLFLLWRGLARYMVAAQKRYFFGCCSLTSQDPQEGRQVMSTLEAGGHVCSAFRVQPQPDYRCYGPGLPLTDGLEIRIPRLFQLYLDVGAKVCGPPALDRRFKTIDYLVLLDSFAMDPKAREVYFK